METAAPAPVESEIEIATIHIVGKQAYRLTLLPSDLENVTHQAATEWAASIGGDLPNRHEQALLYANQREQFVADVYWSNTLHESDPDYAWYQLFDFGLQSYFQRSYKLRARAVRRLPI